VGPDGSLFISDSFNHRIRRVGPDDIITTVAGNGIQGFSGDGGPAVAAALQAPNNVAVGPDGSLFISDWATTASAASDPTASSPPWRATALRASAATAGPRLRRH
jgi:hypothetical protein